MAVQYSLTYLVCSVADNTMVLSETGKQFKVISFPDSRKRSIACKRY